MDGRGALASGTVVGEYEQLRHICGHGYGIHP
jgi:hypothetical protein